MVEKLPFLSDDFHFAIASVAARSAQMEHHIELAIAHLLHEKPNTGKFILKNLGQDRTVKLYHALMLDEFPDENDFFDELVRMIEDLRRDRNEILHWLWGKTEHETIAKHTSRRPHRPDQEKLKTAEQVQMVADAMLKMVEFIVQWQMLVGKKHKKPLPEIPLPPVPPGGLLSALAAGQSETPQPPARPKDSSQE